MKKCAFSGHRYELENLDKDLLERVILNLIKNGVTDFLCGMAVGFDMICAEIVVKYKKNYNIKLIACKPCENQSQNFSSANKQRYDKIIESVDEIITLSPNYYAGCMQVRDRFLVDNCSVLVSFLRKNRGGTYYTVNYAKKFEVKVIEV